MNKDIEITLSTLAHVMKTGAHLDDSLEHELSKDIYREERRLYKAFHAKLMDTIRYYPFGKALTIDALDNPGKMPDRLIDLLTHISCQLLTDSGETHPQIIDNAVSAAKVGWPGLEGVANAVLRSISRTLLEIGPTAHERCSALPGTLDRPIKVIPKRLEHARAQFQPMCSATDFLKKPALHICWHDLEHPELQPFQSMLQPIAAPTPHLLTIQNKTDVTTWPGFDAGCFHVMDSSAQLVTRLLGDCTDASVLDACAAPGGKAIYLSKVLGAETLVVNDPNESRIPRLKENLERCHVDAEVAQIDLSKAGGFGSRMFDRILIDAPCSAIGTFRRHPEIRFRKPKTDFPKLQKDILKNCLSLLKPGGLALYITCSPTKDENEEVIRDVLLTVKGYRLLNLKKRLPEEAHTFLTSDFTFRTWPNLIDGDAFTAHLIERTQE